MSLNNYIMRHFLNGYKKKQDRSYLLNVDKEITRNSFYVLKQPICEYGKYAHGDEDNEWLLSYCRYTIAEIASATARGGKYIVRFLRLTKVCSPRTSSNSCCRPNYAYDISSLNLFFLKFSVKNIDIH
jgi:hypothetical protein